MRTTYQLDNIPENGVKITLEGPLVRILFDFDKVSQTNEEGPHADDLYYCESVDVNGRGYGNIVSAIVNDRYSSDDNQALIANYDLAKDQSSAISDEKRQEYIQEYIAYQSWRVHAKEIAKIVTLQIDYE